MLKAALTAAAILLAAAQPAHSQDVDESAGARKLRALNPDFKPQLVEIVNGVFVASGYGVSTFAFIVGEDGVIVIDSGAATITSDRALAEFRKHSSLPISAIIFTHGHGDHIGGALSFFEGDIQPDVWAQANFGKETQAFTESGITEAAVRGRRQAGFNLPMDKRINNGIAPAMRPREGAPRGFGTRGEVVKPNLFLEEKRNSVNIAGIELELVAAPGETRDQLYVWYPEKRVVFSGDNFYKSWPNLYAIRGTPYRDVKSWADAIDMMLAEDPEYLVPGHTQAISGAAAVSGVLTAYRDGIRFVFDKTIEGINQGLTPDELVAYVRLPEALAEHPFLQPYYGHPDWAVRSIFAGYLGWYDGNPTNLFRLSAKQRAKRIVEIAGGPEALLNQAKVALDSGDAQWAAEICDYLIAHDATLSAARLVKADALDMLGYRTDNALARNYYLTVAEELRATATHD